MNFPAQEAVEMLEKLRLRIINSGVERTFALLKGMGDDCQYYRKSLDILLQRDWEDLKKLICKTSEYMEKIDGAGK